MDDFIKIFDILTKWQVLLFIGLYLTRNEIRAALPGLLARITKAPGGWEFQAIQEVRKEVAAIANASEIQKDSTLGELKIDPNQIKLVHKSQQIDIKKWRVQVWLDAPDDFLQQIDKVVFERHSTFKNRFKETLFAPFTDTFKCWGEFTIKAEIHLKSGQILKRQRYITLQQENSAVKEEER